MDVGSGGKPGVAWMKSTDGNWYEVQISGSNPSASVFVNQSPLTYGSSSNAGLYQDNSYGYQLLRANDANVYAVFLTGNSGSVTVNVSQSAQTNNLDYKPYFLMRSISDSLYYVVSVLRSAGTSTLVVNQNSQSLNWW